MFQVIAAQHLAHGSINTGSNSATQEIHQKTTVQYGQELKSELLGNGISFYLIILIYIILIH